MRYALGADNAVGGRVVTQHTVTRKFRADGKTPLKNAKVVTTWRPNCAHARHLSQPGGDPCPPH
eukprot:1726311-Prymnesium_polylepis.1